MGIDLIKALLGHMPIEVAKTHALTIIIFISHTVQFINFSYVT